MLVLLTEYVAGAPVKTEKLNVKMAVYRKAIAYIRYLDAHLTTAEKKLISQRRPYQYILLYPGLLTKALLSYPQYTRELLAGALVFIKAIPALLSQSELVMTHRDLHAHNLLKSGGKLAVIDLQFGLRTVPAYEYILILLTQWQDHTFCQQLYQDLLRLTNDQTLIKGLAVNAVTHVLTDAHFPAERRKLFSDFLQFAVSDIQTKFHYATV